MVHKNQGFFKFQGSYEIRGGWDWDFVCDYLVIGVQFNLLTCYNMTFGLICVLFVFVDIFMQEEEEGQWGLGVTCKPGFRIKPLARFRIQFFCV